MKVLLDTDIGGDLDDALALAYLLRQPRCELLGVTSVGGQADRRAELASAVCHAAGRPEIPVHVGASRPLLGPERQPLAEQAEALNDSWAYQRFGPQNTAVAFLREMIRNHPGEIQLLTIGPLTNIGLLFALDPELPQLLGGLTIMGGSLLAVSSDEEWNLYCDPYAAARVFSEISGDRPGMLSAGIDVTRPCRLSQEDYQARMQAVSGPYRFVAAMAEVFFREQSEIVFHDPLAAALLFEPSLCQTRPECLAVNLRDERHFGRSYAVMNASVKPHQVAWSVDAERFFEHYFQVATDSF